MSDFNTDFDIEKFVAYVGKHPEVLQRINLPLEYIGENMAKTYLQAHPDFFVQNPELLLNLDIPHDCGKADSLLLYQVKMLRTELEERTFVLADLIDLAEDNHNKLETIQKLILELLDSPDNVVLFTNLQGRLRQDMGINETKLFCYEKFTALPKLDTGLAKRQLSLLNGQRAGMFYLNERLAKIFNLEKYKNGSMALCTLDKEQGLLVLAHADKEHFTPEQDTLFIEYLASILTRLLQRQ